MQSFYYHKQPYKSVTLQDELRSESWWVIWSCPRGWPAWKGQRFCPRAFLSLPGRRRSLHPARTETTENTWLWKILCNDWKKQQSKL